MTQPSRPKIRVLLADDHPMVVDGIRSCLEVYDHIDVIGTAENGRQAFEKSRADAPDIVLMDINMPEMNGYEFVCAVRKDDQYKDMRLMMVTTETEMAQVVKALEAGADEYVMKPFTKEMIVEKLKIMGLPVE